MLLRLALALSLPHDAQPPGEATDELRGFIQKAAREFAEATGIVLSAEDLDFVFQEAFLVAAAHEMATGGSNWEPMTEVARGLIDRVDA
ncbi:MAG TPA: hypothetical protein PKY27_08340 [Arachnia sp.]|nr:hypothetical protein [Arachnia sp.]